MRDIFFPLDSDNQWKLDKIPVLVTIQTEFLRFLDFPREIDDQIIGCVITCEMVKSSTP